MNTQTITKKPKVFILATGGTIAGAGDKSYGTVYEPGQLSIDDMLQSVPEISDVADIDGEQIANIGSQHMNSEIWLVLAERVNTLLASSDVDGIVITHGTDTMEETAYFLNLVVNSSKPVVLTGSMRPATARSADGPNNLFDAVIIAGSKESWGRGVLVTVNEKIFGAHDVSKVATTHIDAFIAPNYGPLGHVNTGRAQFYRTTELTHTVNSDFSKTLPVSLPKVAILYSHVDCIASLVGACVSSGVEGIVFAGTGNGNIPKHVLIEINKAQEKGIVIVRSSRTCYGATTRGEIDDHALNTIASGVLNPQKSKILLQLALTKTKDTTTVRKYFSVC